MTLTCSRVPYKELNAGRLWCRENDYTKRNHLCKKFVYPDQKQIQSPSQKQSEKIPHFMKEHFYFRIILSDNLMLISLC